MDCARRGVDNRGADEVGEVGEVLHSWLLAVLLTEVLHPRPLKTNEGRILIGDVTCNLNHTLVHT